VSSHCVIKGRFETPNLAAGNFAAAYLEGYIVAHQEPEEVLHCSLLLPSRNSFCTLPARYTSICCCLVLLLPSFCRLRCTPAAIAAAASCSGQVYLLGSPLAHLLPDILRTLLAAEGQVKPKRSNLSLASSELLVTKVALDWSPLAAAVARPSFCEVGSDRVWLPTPLAAGPLCRVAFSPNIIMFTVVLLLLLLLLLLWHTLQRDPFLQEPSETDQQLACTQNILYTNT
jgi:hypothetical protein